MKESARLLEAAARVIPGGVNSPVRAFRAVGGVPPFIARGEGARVWDVEADKPLTPPLRQGSAVANLDFSPDGRVLLTSHREEVWLWDAETGEPVAPPWRHDGRNH